MAALTPLADNLRELILSARALPAVLMAEAAEGLPAMVAADEFPEATVLRLQSWVNVEFEAALVVLADDAAAAASEVILRGVLEACAHIHYIAAVPTSEERRCRAIRMEWGMAQEMVNMGKQFKDMPDEERAPFETVAEERRKFLEAAHARAGCSGGPRNYGDVRTALHEMVTTEPNLTWAYDMWVVASAVAHQLVPDRIFREVGVDQSDVVEVPLAERAARLDHLLLAYGLAGQRFFQVVKPGRQPERFLTALQGVRNSETLARSLEGEPDV